MSRLINFQDISAHLKMWVFQARQAAILGIILRNEPRPVKCSERAINMTVTSSSYGDKLQPLMEKTVVWKARRILNADVAFSLTSAFRLDLKPDISSRLSFPFLVGSTAELFVLLLLLLLMLLLSLDIRDH